MSKIIRADVGSGGPLWDSYAIATNELLLMIMATYIIFFSSVDKITETRDIIYYYIAKI